MYNSTQCNLTWYHTSCSLRARIVVAAAFSFTSAAAAQTVHPGLAACPYGSGLTNAFSLSIAPDGTIFAGHEDNGVLVRAWRLPPFPIGGAAVAFGDTPLPDPDTNAVDILGIVTGTPGSLVAGGICGPAPDDGCLWRVLPNQQTSVLFGPSPFIGNVLYTRFDHAGRLIFTSGGSSAVKVSTGGFPTVLFSIPGAARSVAIDATDRVYTCNSTTGVISLHNSSGSVADASFATGFVGALAVGPGGPVWGSDVYGVETQSTGGRLIRFSVPDGAATVIGTGFRATDLAFGPDGGLYVLNQPNFPSAQFDLLRLVPCPANFNGIGCVDSQDFFDFLAAFFASNADFNLDGATNSQDFFDFLSAFFLGC